jgi:transposase-like protein
VADYSALKEQAIELRRQGYSLAQIARQLSVHKSAVGRWVIHVPFTIHNDESRQEQLAGFRDPATYERARELRRAGWSYSMITEELGVNQSTLSGWLRDVEIEDHTIIEGRTLAARRKTAQIKTRQHQLRVEQVNETAKQEIANLFTDGLTQRELFLAGLMLYWGEGGKTRNIVSLTNSDPQVIQVYLRWLRECLSITDDCLRANIHCYPDTDIENAQQFWSEVTKIPLNQFYKTQIDTRTEKSVSKQGKLIYGTIHISVTGQGTSDLHRTILSWIEGLHKQLLSE